VGTKYSASVQTGHGANPDSGTKDTGSLFPGVKRPGRDVNHSPPSGVEIKESKAIRVFPLWAFMACSRANFTFFLFVACAYLNESSS
jgi:hypothetical protein